MADDNDIFGPFEEQLTADTPESMTRALNRRKAMFDQQSARERQRRLEQQRHQNIVDVLDEKARASGGAVSPTDQRRMRASQSQIQKISEEFEEGGYWENYRRQRAEAEFVKTTNTMIGSRATHQQISKAARDVGSLGEITRVARTKTSTQIAQEISQARSALVAQQDEMRTMAEEGTTDESGFRLAGIAHQDAINRLGILTGAQSRQKMQRTDLAGRQRSIEGLMQQIGADQVKRGVAEDIAKGDVGTRVEETSRLDDLQSKIMEAGQAFIEALEGPAEKSEELAAKLGDLQDQYDRQKEVVGQMGGPQRPETAMDKVARWSGTASDVLQAGASAVQTIGVDQEMRDIANKTGFAAISNQQFLDQGAALGGDMAAFRRLNSGQYGRAGKQAGWSGALAATAVGMSAAADAAAIGAKVAGESTSLSNLGNAGSALNETVSLGAQRGFAGLAKGVDVARGISKGEATRARFHAEMQREDEIKRAQDISAQAYRDTLGTITLASRGAGGGRAGIFAQMNNAGTRAHLASLGMGADEMASMYSQGISQMGADFRGAKAGSMVARAAALQQGGLMGAGEYMSSVAQLNEVGGGVGNMETVMKNAVAAGMDSSRNIQQMVASINSLSTESALMGISTAAGATNLMGLGIQSKALQDMPAEMRAKAAASMIGKMDQSMSDTSMNMYNVGEMAGLQNIAPDMSLPQLTRFASLKLTELQSIRGTDAASLAARKKFGLDNLAEDQLQKMAKVSLRTEASAMATFMNNPKTKAAFMTALEGSPEDLNKFLASDMGRDIRATTTQFGIGDAGLEILGGAMAGRKGEEGQVPGKGSGGKAVSGAESILAKQYEAMEKLNTRGQGIMEKFYGGIEGFNKKLEQQLGEYVPGEAEARAAKAGEGSLQLKGFDGSVNAFSAAVTEFVNGIKGKIGSGESSEENMMKKRQPTNNVPTRMGQSRGKFG